MGGMSTPPPDAGHGYRNEFLMRSWAKWALALVVAVAVAVAVAAVVGGQQNDSQQRADCIEQTAAGLPCE